MGALMSDCVEGGGVWRVNLSRFKELVAHATIATRVIEEMLSLSM